MIECDTVILAIGQTTKLDFLSPEDGVEVSTRGLIVADRQSLQTAAPGIFAGGDCVFGPRLIIDSVGDGKRIAIGIDHYLRGTKPPDPEFDGIVFSSSARIGNGSDSEASQSVEFFVPLSELRRFEKYDFTGQQLINSGFVLINGERVGLELQSAEAVIR